MIDRLDPERKGTPFTAMRSEESSIIRMAKLIGKEVQVLTQMGKWIKYDGPLPLPTNADDTRAFWTDWVIPLPGETTQGNGGSTPKQYGLPEGAKELQDLIEHREMNFALGNIFKAVYRLGNCDHSDDIRDLNKIIWFAQRELDRRKNGTG